MLVLAETDISVSCVGKGQFIRWYLNGWHYLFLEQGSESQVVEGTEALPSSYSRLALQAYGLKEGDLRAAKTVAFAPSLDLLTVDGWKNAILESGSVETKRTGASLYPISLTVNVFGKVADYSPVAEAVPPLTDLDYLRQIRDANPNSRLPSLWLDSEDPYTQWEGVEWVTASGQKYVTQLIIYNMGIVNINNINKLINITNLYLDNNVGITAADLSGMYKLEIAQIRYTNLNTINLSGCTKLNNLQLRNNKLTSLTTLTSKGLLAYFDCVYNNLPISETNRLIALGFDSDKILPQNP